MEYTCGNVSEAVLRHAELTPERQALICDGGIISYGLLKSRSEALALRFLKLGVTMGDRVVYAMRSMPEFFYTILAAGMLGAVAVGVAFRSSAEAVSTIIQDLLPKCVVCEDSLYETYRAAAPGCAEVIPCSRLRSNDAGASRMAELDAAKKRVCRDTPFLVLYTSGTTRKPKGAILTHGNVLSSAYMQNAHMVYPDGFTSDDVVQHCFPTNHVSGCVECGLAPLIGGGSIILLRDFDPRKVLENTERYRATVLCGVPAMWTKITECLEARSCDLSSVRVCVSGASSLSRTLAEKMARICSRIENPLGMTETSGFCTYCPLEFQDDRMYETVGKIMPELQYKLTGPSGEPVAPAETGQLCIKGGSVISGYISDTLPCDRDGYFITNDIAFEDADGVLHLCGRNDDMFSVGGYNVYPQEIEDVLLRYPGITGAAVLPVPHHSMGQVCRAYLTVARELNFEDVERFLARELIYYKIPRNFVVLDHFPVNALGKTVRAVLSGEIEKEFGKKAD